MENLNLFIPTKLKSQANKSDKVAMKIKMCFSNALAHRDFPILKNHEEQSQIKTYITITYVRVSNDLRNATILFNTLNNEYQQETLDFFNLQTHFFKNLIAKKLKLKYIPELKFKIDTSLAKANNIDRLLRSTHI